MMVTITAQQYQEVHCGWSSTSCFFLPFQDIKESLYFPKSQIIHTLKYDTYEYPLGFQDIQ